ncbi:hypothetical protein [Propionivibrio sp.]|uniref:hypothetical protein n=1 Tax=Propionivibrio sp. TaxID=2212460 RepID=UPI0025EC5402|nr:hypothetical protein [Propionivibrio sp.]MBK7355307.1 hypothetical protein [Propionivibrio sp.]MBK8399701.1 hypothetical protein [Propionivibrio sp.]MBK8743403.1 hypothetical protein [Propionivibrio sp.]MBK8894573.1 hypothetical protein [Propionivibrio sp.]MBL0207057.1 hypothetical protein [Propionivibrio sp.]
MSYRFLRHLRFGAGLLITQREGDAVAVARPPVAVAAQIDHAGQWADPATMPAPIQHSVPGPSLALYGPGDAVAIDRRQILRETPLRESLDADPDLLCAIEFRHAGLPWLMTPFAPAASNDALRPWIALVVVPLGAATLTPGMPLPRLAVSDASQLPKIGEAHAWAHVQASGVAAGDDIGALIATDPLRTLSRLLCPRRLQPRTRYRACVVPTFEAGRRTGLGQDVVAASALAPAWGASGPIELPVYYSWEFTTGEEAGFEVLVRRLQPRPGLTGIGTRPLDASDPGGGLVASTTPVTLALDGALGPTNTNRPAVPTALAQALDGLLDRSDRVGPPRYGRWHAGALRAAAGPVWLDELNRDPVRRVAAALGTRVVQQRQEELMAACWEQVGEILRANQILRQGELAVVASGRVYARRVMPLMADGAVIAFASPGAARVRAHPVLTLRGLARNSCLPLSALTGAFRKAMRTTGPVGRRLRRANDVGPRIGQVLRALAQGLARALPRPLPQAVRLPSAWTRGNAPDPMPALPAALRTRVNAAAAIASKLALRARQPVCVPLDPLTLADRLATSLDPRRTIPRRVRGQLAIPSGVWEPADRIDPVIAAPRIDTPMVLPLIDLGTPWLMPGVDGVPPESVVAVAANRGFIEAYLVGLNHEMARELLWRGFPTDQRGTVFARFWDTTATAGRVDAPAYDIAPIHTWRATSALGAHPEGGAAAQLVMIIRGELVRRFPNATIFLQKARAGGGTRTPNAMIGGPSSEFPIFRGSLGDDLVYLGFRVTPADARGGTAAAPNGYFLVIQEQPRELSFGFSSSDGDFRAEDATRWSSWTDVVWESLRPNATGHLDLAALETTGFGGNVQARPSAFAFEPRWSASSDALAAIALRRPFRLSIHISAVLP